MRQQPLAEDLARTVQMGFVDCVGVMLAGWSESAPAILRNVFAYPADGSGNQTAAAALIYATAAHALDYDDTAFGGHPSAVLVPVLMAEAAECECDGALLARAYAVGYEVWAELVAREQDPLHRKGWHPSAVYGALAAAAASSVVRGLAAEQAGNAVAMAASLAGGVVANFGSMTKPFQLGRAAQSGVLATRLTALGMTAAPDAVEHELGFLRAASPRGRVDTESPAQFGNVWRMREHGLNIKLHPICFAAHRAVNAMQELCVHHNLQAQDIQHVEIEIGAIQAGMLRHHLPQTPAQAKFSAEFAAASIVIAGRCGSSELTPEFVSRPDVQSLMQRTSIQPIHDEDPHEPMHSTFDRVTATLYDGRQLRSAPVAHPMGHFRRPASGEQLWTKFRDCAATRLTPDAAERIFSMLDSLSTLADPRSFISLLALGH